MSSLSSLLLGAANKAADSALDAIFARTKVEAPKPVKPQKKQAKTTSAAEASTSKTIAGVAPPEEIISRAKLAKQKAGAKGNARASTKSEKASEGASANGGRKGKSAKVAVAAPSSPSQGVQKAGKKDRNEQKGSKKRSRPAEDSSDEDQDAETEAVANTSLAPPVAESDSNSEDASSSSDSDIDPSTLVHETLLNPSLLNADGTAQAKSPRKQPRTVDATPAMRDARTTFIGNVPVLCATNKSARKALIRHLITSLPEDHRTSAKLESIRFRSIQMSAPAFSNDGTRQPGASSAASKPDEEDEEEDSDEEKEDNHARKRARRWRDNTNGKEEEETKLKKKAFLTAAQKKRIAYITGEVHEKADSCNAYAVWEVAARSESKKTPQKIAALVVKHANNTVFEGHTLRVDAVSGKTAGNEEQTKTPREIALEQKAKLEEDKRTLYVGSLDFEEKEQAVRELCEQLMKEERGAPSSGDAWVERVRLIRDPETGLGKGFAYVLFKDRECVDEMLALDGVRVKLSKRKLRLDRCKSSGQKLALRGQSNAFERSKAGAAKEAGKTQAGEKKRERDAGPGGDSTDKKRSRDRPTAPASAPRRAPAPRPDIGDSLRSLSKDERKAVKSGDEERLKRRLEKKQAKREGLKAEKAKEALDRKIKAAKTGSGGASSAGRRSGGPARDGKKKTRVREAASLKKNQKKVT